MNIFVYIPYDVLQYVINDFLTPIDRASFNAVLEPTEKIHKKFSRNFAEIRALKAAYACQRRHALILNDLNERINAADYKDTYMLQYADAVKNYTDFWLKPSSSCLFVFRANRNHAAQVLAELYDVLNKNADVFKYITTSTLDKTSQAISLIQSYKPLKHVSLKK